MAMSNHLDPAGEKTAKEMSMNNHSDNAGDSIVLSGDEEVSIGQISDDDDEIIGSITSASLALLSLQDGQQRPHSALDSVMSGSKTSAGATRRKRTC